MMPGGRPVQTRGAIEALAKAAGVRDTVYIVGIRGFFRDSMGRYGKNDIGIYDDALFLVGPEYYRPFNANTDPSALKPSVAVLRPGLHLYRKGRHGISRGPGYPALRPATPGERLPVMRGGRPDHGVAINIHRGGLNTTSSEGCQTIHPDQWREFITNAYALMDAELQHVIPYLLEVKPDL